MEAARANVARGQGFYAIEPGRKAAALQPRDWRPLSLLGVAYEQAKRDDEALAAHRQAVALAWCFITSWIFMIAGPMITMNSTGRKNRIIGTVSLAGRAAAFFSAADSRRSRFSLAITRRAEPSGVP
jgi:hypothetical protein